jgi:hypothetical protein
MAKIKIKASPEQKALLRSVASDNKTEAQEAQYALASTFIAPAIRKVLTQAVVIGSLYDTLPVSENEPQTLPIELFADVQDQDYYRVVGMTMAGGLPTNFDYGQEEVHFHTFKLESFISAYKKYIKAGRLDVLAKMIERMANEILVKKEINLVAPILYALATANNNGLDHVIRANRDNEMLLDDFVNLALRASRLRTSYVSGGSGTPANDTSRGVTDLIVSPETVARLKRIAYNPMNTTLGVAADPGTTAEAATAIPAHEELRKAVYQSTGIPQFYGINIIEAKEFGAGYKFNTLFDRFADTKQYSKIDGSDAAAFGNDDEIIVGIDHSMDALLSPVITDGDTGADLKVLPDDQFASRSEKIGYYGSIQLGALVTDDRALSGMIITN